MKTTQIFFGSMGSGKKSFRKDKRSLIGRRTSISYEDVAFGYDLFFASCGEGDISASSLCHETSQLKHAR